MENDREGHPTPSTCNVLSHIYTHKNINTIYQKIEYRIPLLIPRNSTTGCMGGVSSSVASQISVVMHPVYNFILKSKVLIILIRQNCYL